SLGMDPSVPVTENTEIWAQNTVNFDFDSSVVRASEVYKLTDIANTLVGSPHLGVKVEGHCDERGTEEYNRALGERRANSVRDYLIDAGVGPNQIRTLSYGEDMPADLAHDEAAWAANRRAVFVLLTPKR
ncbi:MAG: OmpA family protein, partial [Limisphaerales bacterium]